MKDILQGSLESNRKQGRPRMNYHTNIKEWTNMSTPAIHRAAECREDWKAVVRRAMRAANIGHGRPRRPQ